MRYINKIVSRLPLTMRLSTGVVVDLRFRIDGQDARVFWDVFTGREYLSFFPALTRSLPYKDQEVTVIDGGAGSGLFTLCVEHYRRAGIIDWKSIYPVAVEPALYNHRQLSHNLARNFAPGTYEILQGVVGKRSGEITFNSSRSHPWSSSVMDRPEVPSSSTSVPFVDLAPYLERPNCVVKLDIEGGEFLFVEAYRDILGSVNALLLEWHKEMGDYEAAERVLEDAGLKRAGVGTDGIRRITRLYIRDMSPSFSIPLTPARALESVS